MRLKIFCFSLWMSVSAGAAKVMSFDEARKQMFSSHPQIQKASAERDAVRASSIPGSLAFLPTFSLTARKDWDSVNTPAPTYESFYGVESRFNLFHWGADYFSFRGAQFLRQRADRDFAQKELEVESEVVKDLLQYIALKQTFEIAKAQFETKNGILKVAKARFDRGLIADQEVEKLAIEVSQTEAQLSDAQRNFTTVQSKVHAYLPNGEVEDVWPWENLISNDQLLKQLPNSSLPDRFDYQSANLAYEFSKAEKRRLGSLILPSLDLTSSYGRVKSTTVPNWNNDWTVGVSLTFLIFDHLQSLSSYREKSAVARAADADIEMKRRLGESELENSSETFLVSRESALQRAQILGRSRALFDKSLFLFKGGRIRVNELGLDEERWLLSRNLAVQGWLAAHTALLDFCHARSKRFDNCLNKN